MNVFQVHCVGKITLVDRIGRVVCGTHRIKNSGLRIWFRSKLSSFYSWVLAINELHALLWHLINLSVASRSWNICLELAVIVEPLFAWTPFLSQRVPLWADAVNPKTINIMLLNCVCSWSRNILFYSNILWLSDIHIWSSQTLLWSFVTCNIQVIVSIFSRIRRLIVVLYHTRNIDLFIRLVT